MYDKYQISNLQNEGPNFKLDIPIPHIPYNLMNTNIYFWRFNAIMLHWIASSKSLSLNIQVWKQNTIAYE